MPSHYHLSTPDRLGNRESAHAVAPNTPRMVKTPLPRMPSSSRRLLTPQNAPREDLDRFVPSRRRMNMDLCRRKLNSAPRPRESSSVAHNYVPATVARSTKLAYEKHLLSTLCNVSTSALDDDTQLKSIFQYGNVSPSKTGKNRRSVVAADPFELDFLRASKFGSISLTSTLTGVPQKKLAAANKLPKTHWKPVSFADVPVMVDDYYTNPLRFSKDNVLAVALGSSVYTLNSSTREMHAIKGAGMTPRDRGGVPNYVRSVEWCPASGVNHFLAVGTSAGTVRVYDTITGAESLHVPLGSSGTPVNALSWNESRSWLTAGFADGTIVSLDMRSRSLTGMTQAGTGSSVCNLTWNGEGTCLASGRNDDTVHLWDALMMRNLTTGRRGPRLVLNSHIGAVKGLAWCPYRRNVLASGGGTADGCIKLWDVSSGSLLNSVSTGSQVSSLAWGRHHQELYSSHGHPNRAASCVNSVVAWSYPKMEQVETLRRHKGRVLSMVISPDGSELASISADKALSIWKVDAVPARPRAFAGASLSFGPRFAIR